MQIVIRIEPVAHFSCRHTGIDRIGLCIFCNQRAGDDDAAFADTHTDHNSSTISYPNIILDEGDIVQNFPVVRLIAYLHGQPYGRAHLLIVMIIAAYERYPVTNYDIIANDHIGFDKGITTDVKIAADHYFLTAPDTNTYACMKTRADTVFPVYD